MGKSQLLFCMKFFGVFHSVFSFGVNGYALVISGHPSYVDIGFPAYEADEFELYSKLSCFFISLVTLPVAATDFVKSVTVRYPDAWSERFYRSATSGIWLLMHHISEIAAMVALLFFQLAFAPSWALFWLVAIYLVGLQVLVVLKAVRESNCRFLVPYSAMALTLGPILFIFDVMPPARITAKLWFGACFYVPSLPYWQHGSWSGSPSC